MMQLYSPDERHNIILESELYVLRAMCQGTQQRPVLEDGLNILSNYPFIDQTHQLIYDALRELNTVVPEILQNVLPRRLAKKGFPDLDIQPFFKPHTLAADVAVSMMEGVQFSARGKVRYPIQ